MRWLWIAAGSVSLAVGIVGIFVPLLPSTVFLLIASYCYARSSDRLHSWLTEHPRFGPPIRHWHEERAIHRRAKRNATVVIAAGFVFSAAVGLHLLVLAAQALVLSAVCAFIWTRPEPTK